MRLALPAREAFALAVPLGVSTIGRVVSAVLLRAFREKAVTVAVDGKRLRGSRCESGAAMTVLGAMLQEGTLIAQQRVPGRMNEITGFAALLAALDLAGPVVTANALLRARACADAGRGVRRPLRLRYQAQPARPVGSVPSGSLVPRACRLALHRSRARSPGDVDHRGRDLGGSRLPYLLVARITRYRTRYPGGKRFRERVYVITDLSLRQACPQRIGERGTSGIENRVHYMRDITLGLNAFRIRTDHEAQNMATLLSVATNFLRRTGSSIADARRRLASHHAQPRSGFSSFLVTCAF
ncbi:hypothetical protein AB0D08_36640 [Kitasatospora sp. NPDC048540]|uniref:hypothetical protein n=1 Tax=Kitasatospora sp. NPDC048540 TaxID=3155634 RepID=UPI0033ECBC58